jgi:hypothetical protein
MELDLENLTPEQFQALPEEQRLAILTGQEAPAPGDPPPPDPAAAPPPGVPAQAEQGTPAPGQPPGTPPEPGQAPPENRGDLNVALHQSRQRANQLAAMLQDPQTIAALHAQMFGGGQSAAPAQQPQAPELQYEDGDAIRAIVEQVAAPMRQQIEELTQANRDLMAERQVSEMKGRHPDLDQFVAEFDTARPDLAHVYNAEEKKYLILGARAADPEWMKAQVETAAQTRAEALLAEKLAGITSKTQTPVTLAGVTPAQRNDTPPDLANLSRDQWNGMSDAKRRELLGG